jgi:hypothetical protein
VQLRPVPDRARAAFVTEVHVALLTAAGVALIAAVGVVIMLAHRARSAAATATVAAA